MSVHIFVIWVLLQFLVIESAKVTLTVTNLAGNPIELLWIDPSSPSAGDIKLVPVVKSIPHGSKRLADSFDGHKFIARFVAHHVIQSPNAPSTTVQSAEFIVGASNSNIVIRHVHANANLIIQTKDEYDNDMTNIDVNHSLDYGKIDSLKPNFSHLHVNRDIDDNVKEAVRWCKSQQETSDLITINNNSYNITNSKDAFQRCLTAAVQTDYQQVDSKFVSVKKQRDSLASKLRNRTCADDSLTTSTPLFTQQFEYSDYYDISGKSNYNHNESIDKQTSSKSTTTVKQVHTLLNHTHAKIWTMDDFVTQEECDTLMAHGLPRLYRATVAAEDGSSIVSENRKAQQAVYDLRSTSPSDPLWPLYRRILNMTHQLTGYALPSQGQEHFAIIQYNIGDQYTPHCDGACDGSEYRPGGRVATALLFCKTADSGGGTTFSKSDIYIKPTNRTAVFFSYLGSDNAGGDRSDNTADCNAGSAESSCFTHNSKQSQQPQPSSLLVDPLALTEHSGCPVTTGEKWVTTLWMRLGVSEDQSWTLFDPSGVRLASDVLASSSSSFESKINKSTDGTTSMSDAAADFSAILYTFYQQQHAYYSYVYHNYDQLCLQLLEGYLFPLKDFMQQRVAVIQGYHPLLNTIFYQLHIGYYKIIQLCFPFLSSVDRETLASVVLATLIPFSFLLLPLLFLTILSILQRFIFRARIVHIQNEISTKSLSRQASRQSSPTHAATSGSGGGTHFPQYTSIDDNDNDDDAHNNKEGGGKSI